MPNVIDDRLDVFNFQTDSVAGAKPEPEEMPGQRTLKVDAPATGTESSGQKLGDFNASIALEIPAGEIAVGASKACVLCKHFDQPGWHALKRQMESTADGLRYLSEFRHELMLSGNAAIQAASPDAEGEGVDAEHAMMSLGLCRIMSEIANSPRVVYPVATCPEGVPDDANQILPMPQSWEPRTSYAEKVQSATYDEILRKAQGRWGR